MGAGSLTSVPWQPCVCAEHRGCRPHWPRFVKVASCSSAGTRCPRASSADSLPPPTGDGSVEPGAVPRPQGPHPPRVPRTRPAVSGRHRAASAHPRVVCEGDSRGSICKQAGVPPHEAPLAEGRSRGSGQREQAVGQVATSWLRAPRRPRNLDASRSSRML